MKKTYEAPTALPSGDVIKGTCSGINPGAEGVKLPFASGRMGFYL